MYDAIDSGIRGIETHPGQHICGLYSGDRERDEILVPFLEAGLRAGDKCICVVDGAEPLDVIGALDPDVDARARADRAQLDVMRASDTYLRSGSFSAAEVIGLWKMTISEAMYDGRFDMVRAVETWSQRDVIPEPGELRSLESEMNRFVPLYPQVILCLYDVGSFGGGIVVDLLRTHPKVLLGGMILDNPYYTTPDAFLAEAGSTPAPNEA